MLEQTTNFQMFITIMNEKQTSDKKDMVLQVLQLMLPGAKVVFTPRSMLVNFNELDIIIDEQNFEIFQNSLRLQFNLGGSGQETFKPQNEKAREIAQKLMRGRQRVAAQKEHGGSQFAQYLSVITVALGSMSLNDAMGLTMYQLYDLVERYGLYLNWDLDIRSRLAGATADKPMDNWMKNIH